MLTHAICAGRLRAVDTAANDASSAEVVTTSPPCSAPAHVSPAGQDTLQTDEYRRRFAESLPHSASSLDRRRSSLHSRDQTFQTITIPLVNPANSVSPMTNLMPEPISSLDLPGVMSPPDTTNDAGTYSDWTSVWNPDQTGTQASESAASLGSESRQSVDASIIEPNVSQIESRFRKVINWTS